jgi:hypothetical protein
MQWVEERNTLRKSASFDYLLEGRLSREEFMQKNTLSATLLAAALTTPCLTATANAQATRTWVSGVGDDANPCSRTAPCKTFAGAISKTFINGEIDCLDPGGFGTVTITKSITIDCTGTFGSILASGTNGVNVNIAVNANDPTRSVRLRGLTINGAGASGTVGTRTGVQGLNIINANAVSIEDTIIAEFSQNAVLVNATSSINLSLQNVTIRDTNGTGLRLLTTAGQIVASLNDVRIIGTPVAFAAAGLTRTGMRNVMISHNNIGIQTSGNDNIVNADNIMITFAGNGAVSNPSSTIRLSNSVITQNVTGLSLNGGAIVSMSGNAVFGNSSDGAFSSTAGKL